MSGCRICGAEESEEFATTGDYRFERCRSCDFVYLNPMPDQAALNALYQDDRGINPGFYPKAKSRKRRALMRALRFRHLVRGKCVIDVGCGGGFMTDALRAIGGEASGLDVNTEAIGYARHNFPKCTFYCASFDAFREPQQYDFVYSSELIEHINGIDEYMNLLRRITANGGHVFITTPDLGSPVVPDDVTTWDVFAPPHHVQFFKQANLERLFRNYDFEPVRRFPDRKAGIKMLFRQAV
jgi:2-polyprenyl-3-methyl-5-hydroxy-6-metoxy-1,4-benzoquinol methylase